MKKIIPLIAIILLFITTVVWAEKNAEDWFNEGVNALEVEDYDKAIKCFNNALAINPNFSLDTVYGAKGMARRDLAGYRETRAKGPIDLPSFEESAERLLEKTKLLREKAQTFEEKEVLMNLGESDINGFYYRFDENIKEAIYEKESLDKENTQKDSTTVNFDFNSLDTLKFKPKKGNFILEEGVLKFRYLRGDYLESTGNLNIIKDTIGEIELRIKLKKGRRVQLAWSKDSSVDYGKANKGVVTVETVPDGSFHTYRINAKNALRRHLDSRVIKKVFLFPLDVDYDEVEVDYIRFISKREKYSEELYEETYETIEKEMRKVLYTNTSLCLKYSLDIPKSKFSFRKRPLFLEKSKVFLSFGVGILERNDPVTFRVTVKSKKKQEEIFSKEIINPDTWHDAKIDLSKWSGKKVEISFHADSEKGNIAFWSNPILYVPPKKRFNVIIVLEDALRADHMSCYNYFRETTPVKDKLIKNGVLFQNAFSQATKTRPSCPTIMTSLYPTATGVWHFSEMLDDNHLTLAEIMRNQGFATASFIQNGNAGSYAGLHQGFNNLFRFSGESINYRAERMYDKRLYAWMEKQSDRNVFIYLHLLDPHGVYDPPKPFDSWYREAAPGKTLVKRDVKYHDPEWVETPTIEGRRTLYDGEIRYNDFCFGKFLETLKEKKLLDDTMIVLISDHGEHLGEHELWEHKPPGYIQGIHVPLLMVYPEGLPGGKKINQPVQLIDIMPTILDLAEIDRSNLLLQGDSLVSLIQGEDSNFWDNRLSISEEVFLKSKEDKSEWASVFYKNWHMLNSNEINDDLFKTKLRSNKKIYETFFVTKLRVFDYIEDKEEEHYLPVYLTDQFFKEKIRSFIGELQEDNMAIWKNITKDTEKTIKYDPEVLEQLRGLGYLE